MARSGAVIGRNAELELIANFLSTISAGCAGLVLTGEAGIGKSTVWGAALTAARSRSFTVLSCRCANAEANLPFSALSDLLGPALDGDAVRLPPPQARALDIALLRSDPTEAALDTRAVSRGFLEVVRQLAEARPVLIAIDDVQWMDTATAPVVEFALRRLESEPVAVLASVRSPLDGGLPLDLSGALGGCRTLPIGPLTLEAVTKILHDQAGVALSRPLVWRIFQASGGNPFYALELARELRRYRPLPAPGQPLRVPVSLARLVEARLAGLPPSTRELLLLVAAAAQPTVALLAQAFHGEPIIRSLQPAVDRGVTELVDGEAVRFAHPLWESAVYSGATADARQRAHLRLAAVTADAEARARHLALAAEQPSEEVAASLSQAALRARLRGAALAAAEYAALAARLTPGQEEQWPRRIEAADYMFHAGAAVEARRLLEELVAELPPGPVRAQARASLGRIRTYEAGNQAAIAVLELALEDARGHPMLQAEIHQEMAWICDFDLTEGLRHADAAVGLLDGADAPGLLAGAIGAKLWLEFLLGHGVRLDLAERASELERQARTTRAVDGVELPLGAMLKSADRLDEARDKLESVLRAVEREQDDSSRFEVVLELGHLECLAGRWQLAERYAREAAEFVELTGQDELRPAVLSLGGMIDALTGRLDSARAKATEGLNLAEASRSTWFALMTLPVLGFTELSAGTPELAARYLERADEECERIGLREPGRFRFHADYVEALIACGEHDRAADVLSRIEDSGRALGRPWALATAARCRCLLLAAMSEVPASLAQVQIALHHHEQLPMPFELARTLLVGGQVHRRARHKREAKDMLSEAETIFSALGATIWAARACDGLSRLGIRAPAPSELTVTERQVAELAAAGLTNREIAEQMFISVRTAEANLSRVYRKLGLRSRAELARDFGTARAATQA